MVNSTNKMDPSALPFVPVRDLGDATFRQFDFGNDDSHQLKKVAPPSLMAQPTRSAPEFQPPKMSLPSPPPPSMLVQSPNTGGHRASQKTRRSQTPGTAAMAGMALKEELDNKTNAMPEVLFLDAFPNNNPNTHLQGRRDTADHLLNEAISGLRGSDVSFEQEARMPRDKPGTPPSVFQNDFPYPRSDGHPTEETYGLPLASAEQYTPVDPLLLAIHPSQESSNVASTYHNGSPPSTYVPYFDVEDELYAQQQAPQADLKRAAISGLRGNFSERFQVNATEQTITLLQDLVKHGKLMTPANGDWGLVDALKTTLHDLQRSGTLPDITALLNSLETALDPDLLTKLGLSRDQIQYVLEVLPVVSGTPRFHGDRYVLKHPSFAFRICKLISILLRNNGHDFGLRLLITTASANDWGAIEVFEACQKPNVTVCLHREIVGGGDEPCIEHWKPYYVRPEQADEQAKDDLPEQSLQGSNALADPIMLDQMNDILEPTALPAGDQISSMTVASEHTLTPRAAHLQHSKLDAVDSAASVPTPTTVPAQTAVANQATASTPAPAVASIPWAAGPPPPPVPVMGVTFAPTAVPAPTAAPSAPIAPFVPAFPGQQPPPPIPAGLVGTWRWMHNPAPGYWSWQSAKFIRGGVAHLTHVKPRILKAFIELGDLNVRNVTDQTAILLSEGYANTECGEILKKGDNTFYNSHLKKALQARADQQGRTRKAVLQDHQQRQAIVRPSLLLRSGLLVGGQRDPLYRTSGESVQNAKLLAQSAAYTAAEAAQAKRAQSLAETQGKKIDVGTLAPSTLSGGKRKRDSGDNGAQDDDEAGAAQPRALRRSTRGKRTKTGAEVQAEEEDGDLANTE